MIKLQFKTTKKSMKILLRCMHVDGPKRVSLGTLTDLSNVCAALQRTHSISVCSQKLTTYIA